VNLFRKIFSSSTNEQKKASEKENEKNSFIKKNVPIDELFTINFKENGGKFLYSDSIDEVYEFLEQIFEENNWNNIKVLIFDSKLKKKFKNFNWKITKKLNEANLFFTTCENLIAADGSILISSNQIAEKKLIELPKNFIVFASTSQIVQNIGQGLHGIKAKSKKKIPSNITTIKHFKIDNDNNFLSYGSSAKNLYLILLEDL